MSARHPWMFYSYSWISPDTHIFIDVPVCYLGIRDISQIYVEFKIGNRGCQPECMGFIQVSVDVRQISEDITAIFVTTTNIVVTYIKD